jgi:hypothetical protein
MIDTCVPIHHMHFVTFMIRASLALQALRALGSFPGRRLERLLLAKTGGASWLTLRRGILLVAGTRLTIREVNTRGRQPERDYPA